MHKIKSSSLLILAALLIVVSCKQEPKSKDTEPTSSVIAKSQPLPLSVKFVDITREAGITFVHNNGAFGKKYLPESMGSGCAFLDYNNDGWLDILLINSMDWPTNRRRPSFSALYKNNRDGTFKDVTRDAGLALEMYGLGTTIGDYDNDGDPDIYISCLGPDHLFRNNGDETFSDVTKRAGLGDPDFGTSCTWFDYDKDGRLDLYVANYVKWSIENDLFCTLDGTNKSYCTPESYDGESPRLYHNRGDGTFEDTTEIAGLFDPASKALGVVALDYDQDHWPDLFVANDTQPNKLYHNKHNGSFTETGAIAGVAYSEAGVARAGMGVDAIDYDGSGYPSLIIGNFSNEMMGLYHNEGTGLFIDEAPASTVGQATLLKLTFGAFFFDFDLDGNPDILGANGHVHDDIGRVQQQVTYAQPPHLFRNLGEKRFEEATRQVGNDFSRPIVARGAAFGDIDNDGDLDVLITTNAGPAHLFRNDGGNKNNFIKFKTVGSKSNHDGIGTKIVIHLNDASEKWQEVKSGASYCSQSELAITFGLGSNKQVKQVEVFWPSGQTQTMENVKANQLIVLKEKT
jgi:enediyne biosynthesis protein E4